MKKITLLVSVLFVSFTSFSQVIPNAGFETWINNTESGHTYLVPQKWITSDAIETAFQSTYVGTSVVKTSSSYAGTSAVLMQTCINNGDTIGGSMYSCDSVAQFANFIFGGGHVGFPYTLRSATLTGYYKLTAVGGDSASVGITMTKWNSVTHTRDTLVNQGIAKGVNVGVYTQFSMNLTYLMNLFPDTAFMYAGIRATNKTHVGTMFYLDALAMSGTVPVGINELPADNKFVSVFPNPFSSKATIQIDSKVQLNKAALKIYDILGNEVRNIQSFSANTCTIEKDELQSGIYFYTLINSGATIANGKFVVE